MTPFSGVFMLAPHVQLSSLKKRRSIRLVSPTKAIKLSIFEPLWYFTQRLFATLALARDTSETFGKFRLKRKPRGLENNPGKEGVKKKKNQCVVSDWTDFYLEKTRPKVSCNE